jgi:hypothetical protein
VCNSKREKDKAIQPLQGKDFTVTKFISAFTVKKRNIGTQ